MVAAANPRTEQKHYGVEYRSGASERRTGVENSSVSGGTIGAYTAIHVYLGSYGSTLIDRPTSIFGDISLLMYCETSNAVFLRHNTLLDLSFFTLTSLPHALLLARRHITFPHTTSGPGLIRAP